MAFDVNTKKGKATNIVSWGDNHKKYFKNYEEAKDFAYEKAFYFETKLNYERVNRKF